MISVKRTALFGSSMTFKKPETAQQSAISDPEFRRIEPGCAGQDGDKLQN
jgi:hypothetical protein